MVPGSAWDRLSTPRTDPHSFAQKKQGRLFQAFPAVFSDQSAISGDRLCVLHRDVPVHDDDAAGAVQVCNNGAEEQHRPVSAAGEVPHKPVREPPRPEPELQPG